MEILTNILTTAGLIIIAVLLFELIIFFHEGGHFITAKLSGIKVNEFALGMGPKIFSFKRKETTYSLRLFPIGGFCAMEGEDEESDNPRAFNNAKIYKRMIVIVAGALMNIILGLIFMGILLAPSKYFTTTEISAFSPKSYSANSGLMIGDKLISVDGYKVHNSLDISYALSTIKVGEYDGEELQIYKQDCCNELYDAYAALAEKGKFDGNDELNRKAFEAITEGALRINATANNKEAYEALQQGVIDLSIAVPNEDITVQAIEVKETRQRFRTTLEVERNGEIITLENVDFFTYTTADAPDTPQMAVDFYLNAKDNNFFTLCGETGSQTVSVVRMVYDSLYGLVTGEYGFNDLSGPVGIATVTVEMAQEGLKSGFGDAVENILYIMMVITVNLGIVNMLPFPALDGGRFVFLLIEAIFRKPVPRKFEAVVNAVGLALLILLIIVITFKDVFKLFV